MVKKKVAHWMSSIYKTGLKISQSAYRKVPHSVHKVGARVISIGNITWGGTGKTPFTVKLAKELSREGKKVAVLTRGYGKDEVLELKKKLQEIPVFVGRDRIRTASEAIKKFGVDTLILDDGFQHIRLHRDLDVVMIDSTQPFGPGGLIPAGTLREPVEHLSRADIFVLTKCNIGAKNVHWIEQKIQTIKPGAVIFEAIHEPVQFTEVYHGKAVSLEAVRGRKIAALSSIGDPLSFEKTLERLGADIHFAARYDDHHAYRLTELEEFFKRLGSLGVRDVVTTEKDIVKLEPLMKKLSQSTRDRFNVLVLQIEFRLNDEEDFLRRCLNP